MIVIRQMKITFDYPVEFDKYNHDLVAFVFQRYPRRVISTSVVRRGSVDAWYEATIAKYPKKDYVLMIGTISLIGAVSGVTDSKSDINDEEFEMEDEKPKKYGKSKDPSAN